MPTIVCRTCGRVVYTTAPIDALFAEERRCPRCGAYLERERRVGSRRHANRRQNPSEAPGPPGGAERRGTDRRTTRRRADDRGPYQG